MYIISTKYPVRTLDSDKKGIKELFFSQKYITPATGDVINFGEEYLLCILIPGEIFVVMLTVVTLLRLTLFYY